MRPLCLNMSKFNIMPTIQADLFSALYQLPILYPGWVMYSLPSPPISAGCIFSASEKVKTFHQHYLSKLVRKKSFFRKVR